MSNLERKNLLIRVGKPFVAFRFDRDFIQTLLISKIECTVELFFFPKKMFLVEMHCKHILKNCIVLSLPNYL